MKNWIEFKKSFTKEQEDAIWQYFLDHSKIERSGYWNIQFYARNVDDFWKRLFARYTGDFQRYDKLNKEHTQAIQSYHYMQWQAKRHHEIVGEIGLGNNYLKKLALFIYRRLRNYLFK